MTEQDPSHPEDVVDEYLRLTPSPSGAVSERMQALLSRAVEDQVNEQREVQSLLNEVKNALAEVQRDTRISPAGNADLRAELATHSSETRVQLTLLDERLEALVRAVSTSAQVLQGLSGQLERLSEAVRDRSAEAGRTEPIAQVRHEVADLRTQVGGMESLLHGEIATLGERFASEVNALRDMSGAITQAVTDHVDNAVLVLAEALLRRPAAAAADEAAEPPAQEARSEREDLLTSEPVREEPAAVETVAAEPVLTEPVLTEPVPAEPVPTEPAAVEPAVTELAGAGEAALPEAEEPPAVAPTPASAPALGPNLAHASAVPAEEAYDDVLSEIPESEIPESEIAGSDVAGSEIAEGDTDSVFPQFRQAPYDLERALFGDRSRVFVASESATEADLEPDVAAGSPPEDIELADVDEQHVTEDEGQGGQATEAVTSADSEVATGPSDESTVRREDVFVAYEDEEGAASEDDDEDDEPPRRRPWWRPSN